MYELISKLIMYRKIARKGRLFYQIASSISGINIGDNSVKAKASISLLNCINNIFDFASHYKIDSDIWTSYIAFLIATDENPFSIEVEKRGAVNDTLKELALKDFDALKKVIDYDFTSVKNELGEDYFEKLKNYKTAEETKEQLYDFNISDKINEFAKQIKNAKDGNDLYSIALDFYKKYGVGKFGLNKAFRISQIKSNNIYDEYEGYDIIEAIEGTSKILFSDLIGYEDQKEQLIKNTEAFINGKEANNVLLYGDAGTGKSSSIKALLNKYYDDGLRIIEVYKYDFKYLPEIISILKRRNYKFIIYMDDLSFEKNETEYKYLKAVIEGGLEVRPENVLVYATSNRVHLLHETFSDRKEVESDDVHISDTLTEQTSLANRFGLTIAYYNVKRQEFFDMICTMAKQNEKLISMSKEELIKRASLWNMYHGDYSGRAAKQFISYLISTL